MRCSLSEQYHLSIAGTRHLHHVRAASAPNVLRNKFTVTLEKLVTHKVHMHLNEMAVAIKRCWPFQQLPGSDQLTGEGLHLRPIDSGSRKIQSVGWMRSGLL